mgnify:FL=1
MFLIKLSFFVELVTQIIEKRKKLVLYSQIKALFSMKRR